MREGHPIMDHFYAFSLRPGATIPSYERTFPTADYARAWCRNVTARTGRTTFFMVNCLPYKFFY
jgi:hypothetical protein